MELHSLMSEFTELPHAIVGVGPRHPESPDEEFESEMEDYFADRSYLQAYTDYLAFMRSYGGAGVYYPDSAEEYIFLTIFGFGKFSEGFGEPLDPQGFYTFATNVVRFPDGKDVEYLFAFDTTGNRKAGVYRKVVQLERPGIGDFRYANRSFLDWLQDVISKKGRPVGSEDSIS